MQTKLLELKNNFEETLRGIWVEAGVGKTKAVLMVGGFERSATTEKKFKVLADKLVSRGVDSLRFDAADCGLSDGDFSRFSLEKMTSDVEVALINLKHLGYQQISVVAHSIGCCAAVELADRYNLDKLVLLGPALNQKDLLRYYFVVSQNPTLEINWTNYKNYLDEAQFLKSVKLEFFAKQHQVSGTYKTQGELLDLSSRLVNMDPNKLLLIQGLADDKVPPNSLGFEFKNKILIEKGDHDLEKPGIFEQWIDRAVEFLI